MEIGANLVSEKSATWINVVFAAFLVSTTSVCGAPAVISSASATSCALCEGCWIDAKTGEPVNSIPGPSVYSDSGSLHVGWNSSDPNHASNPKTGQNFVRVPCPAPEEHTCVPRAPSQLESAVLSEINAARTDPAAYARRLRPEPYVDVTEAAGSLKKQAPVPALVYDPCVASVAIVHEEDQGPKGGESHVGSDGSQPNDRMRAVGLKTSKYAEVISVYYTTALGVVQQLLVDQPGPNHPHRDELFDPTLTDVGVGCGPNAKFGAMCVIDLTSRRAPKTASPDRSLAGFTHSQIATNSCWIDAKTGEPVPTGPAGWLPGGRPTASGRFENPDPNHVHDTETERTYVKDPEEGWIDARTGEPVPTGPPGWLPGGRPSDAGRVENPDPNHVHDTETGRTYVRVPCPPG